MMRDWLFAFRPKTLTAAVVPILVGVSLGGLQRWWIAALALAASLFIQIATNLVNDAKDFETGADREDRLGPKRVTQAGVFSSQTVLKAALFFFLLAVLAGLPLVYHGGWPILAIGLFSIAAGYAYTAGPFPLAYRGMGDLFVFIFFGIIAISGMHFLISENWSLAALVAGAQIGALCTVLIAINNLRDVESDARANKRTLAVRFGPRFVRIEITLLILLGFGLQLFWWNEGETIASALPFLLAPLAISLLFKVWTTEPSPKWNGYLGQAAALHLFFGLLLSVGLLWA